MTKEAHRLPGDQKVVGTYWFSHSLQVSSNCAGDFGIPILERERVDGACKKCLKALRVEFSTRTLCNAVPEFEQGDGRNENLGS